MRIGAHVSVAGGLARAVGNATAVGCESLQVFVSNPRGWAPPPVDPAGDERFRAELATAGLGPLFVHAPYLVNFASAGPATLERSRAVVAATLAKAAAIGAAGVVVHAGHAQASGRAAGLASSREALLPLADAAAGLAGGTELVLELTAGTRGALAARFEEMAELLAACDHHPRLKVCMDTCHAHAAGYDLADPAGATKAMDELFATLDDRVVLVHANDSRDPAGAGRDRHCPIGTGTIGDRGFAAVLAHPGLAPSPSSPKPPATPTRWPPTSPAWPASAPRRRHPTPTGPDPPPRRGATAPPGRAPGVPSRSGTLARWRGSPVPVPLRRSAAGCGEDRAVLRPAYPLETARLVLRPFSAGDLEDEGQTLVLAAVWRETATVYAMLEDEWVGRLSRGRPG